MKLTASGIKLRELLEKAIRDCVITNSEYESIMNEANKDGHIDAHEQQLLRQFQSLIQDGTLTRIKG